MVILKRNGNICELIENIFAKIWRQQTAGTISGQLSCVTVSLRDGQQLGVWETSILDDQSSGMDR